MAALRLPYSLEEDRRILRYIIDGHYEPVIKGNAVWMKMEEDNLCPGRSWQSMKNRFKRNIMPDVSRPEFGLTHDEKVSLKAQLSCSMSDAKPLTKRQIDPRLIRDRIEKQNSNDPVGREMSTLAIADSTSETGTVEGNSLSLSSGNSNAREILLTSPEKSFYSLDMQWSDSD